jgi:hypothetical protein
MGNYLLTPQKLGQTPLFMDISKQILVDFVEL